MWTYIPWSVIMLSSSLKCPLYCRGTMISRLNLDERLAHKSLVKALRCLHWEQNLLLYDGRSPDKCIVIVKPVRFLLKCKFTFQVLIVLIKVIVERQFLFVKTETAVLATVPKQRKEASQLDFIFGLLIGSLVPVTESSRVTKMSFYPVSKSFPLIECQQNQLDLVIVGSS